MKMRVTVSWKERYERTSTMLLYQAEAALRELINIGGHDAEIKKLLSELLKEIEE